MSRCLPVLLVAVCLTTLLTPSPANADPLTAIAIAGAVVVVVIVVVYLIVGYALASLFARLTPQRRFGRARPVV